MRHALRQLLTLLVGLSLMPGWGELLENLEHVVHDGHLAHAVLVAHADDEAHGHEALEAEHGCTPVQHTCPCHVSVPALAPEGAALPEPVRVAVRRDRPPVRDDRPLQRAQAPPLPPPRA